MGAICVAVAPACLRTVLGSCVGLALYDAYTKVGGLAHIVLPESRGEASAVGKFADTAVPGLIEAMLKQGAKKSSLSARVVGGARMFKVVSMKNIGEMNIVAVRDLLKARMIPVVMEDLGGEKGRRMTLDLHSGEVLVEFPGDAIAR
jgi:chemotaxis protein CheD